MQEKQKGQILLIVVLVMATALTVGLAVVSRSITDKKTSQESANSQKAFSAAEAGIERSLTTTTNTTINGKFPSNNTKYSASVITISGNQFPLNNAQPVLKDDTITLWLSTYPTYANPTYPNPPGGKITFYWGQAGDNCQIVESKNSMAALELTVISGSATTPHLTRYAFDPCGARRGGNNLSAAGGGGTIPGVSYNYRFSATITVTKGLFIDATPLYATTVIGVKCNGGGCPSQGTVIQSVGTADNTQRKLITYHIFPQLPSEMFQYSLFAP